MQRLFSSFPRGRPGVGLLLLRAAVGVSLIVHGRACLAGEALVAGLLAMLTGAAILIGFMTPLAALLAEFVFIGNPDVLGGGPATIYLIVMAAALFLLGPGAWSLDARWFGRREIVIPQD